MGSVEFAKGRSVGGVDLAELRFLGGLAELGLVRIFDCRFPDYWLNFIRFVKLRYLKMGSTKTNAAKLTLVYVKDRNNWMISWYLDIYYGRTTNE